MRNKPTKYTPEMIEFLAEGYKVMEGKDLLKAFNTKFETNVNYDALLSYMERHGIRSGRSYCFQKGHTPYNKNKKLADLYPPDVLERIAKTQFKKGQRPANYRPVGSMRINVDGYREIKVADKGTQHQRWHLYHKEIWEKEYGPVPEGHILIFIDGDSLNCSLDNLKLVTKKEHMMLNKCHLRGVDEETTQAGLNIVKLKLAIIDRRKELKDGNKK